MQHDPAKDKPIELELSWVCDASNRMHQLVPADLKVRLPLTSVQRVLGSFFSPNVAISYHLTVLFSFQAEAWAAAKAAREAMDDE